MSACGKCGGSGQVCNCIFESQCQQNTFLGDNVNFPGTTGNYAFSLDSSALDLTGDLDIRVKLAAADYTPASSQTLFSKWNSTGNQGAYLLRILSTGALEIATTANGTTVLLGASTVSTGFTDGTIRWVRGNLDANDGAGNRVYRFYTSLDGVNWTQLGATVTTPGVAAIQNSTADAGIGSFNNGTSELFNGKIYYAELRRGPNITTAASGNRYDGDIVAVFDPGRATVTGPQLPITVSSQTGETWTLVGSGWSWNTLLPAPTCSTLTGNGRTSTPINYHPNNVPLPRPYGFIQRPDSTQSILNGTSTAIIFQFENNGGFNGGGMANIAATPTRLTAPVAGYYLTYGTFSYDGGLIELSIAKNGSIVPAGSWIAHHQAMHTLGTLTATTLIDMAVGDYLELYARNFTGGTVTVLNAGWGGAAPQPFPGISSTPPTLWAQWIRPLDE